MESMAFMLPLLESGVLNLPHRHQPNPQGLTISIAVQSQKAEEVSLSIQKQNLVEARQIGMFSTQLEQASAHQERKESMPFLLPLLESGVLKLPHRHQPNPQGLRTSIAVQSQKAEEVSLSIQKQNLVEARQIGMFSTQLEQAPAYQERKAVDSCNTVATIRRAQGKIPLVTKKEDSINIPVGKPAVARQTKVDLVVEQHLK
ncbi:hypothetical protein NDU88_006092 [Pleurodeles waltl]|uniref:Uncharacterized protein n=1 Tax=Pleurodeles waltl TaxID=8319 RepID=A0AAV7VQ34_PLEWA|nr:hypothetical protein NDU88_006092 [Pleurodeles waltl]